MKILIGITEVSNNIIDMACALRESGHDVYTIAVKNKYYMANEYDYVITCPKIIQRLRFLRDIWLHLIRGVYFVRFFFNFDTFVFVFRTTLLPLNIDLFLYKLFKKNVIIFNVGSDVRYIPIQHKIEKEFYKVDRNWYRNLGRDRLNNLFLKTFLAQKVPEITKSKVISTRNQATFQKLKKYHFKFPTKKRLDSPKKPSDVPLIIHAPSNRKIKGTHLVLEAVKRLIIEDLNFEFEIIENRNNDYVISRLFEADIVIDQPGSWIAKFSSEGLSCSCVVFTGIDNQLEGYPNTPPVIQFREDVDELTNDLRVIINDKKLRQNYMTKSYRYWQENYSYESFARYFRDVLNGNAETFDPLPNHKEVLKRFALNGFQRVIIKLLY